MKTIKTMMKPLLALILLLAIAPCAPPVTTATFPANMLFPPLERFAPFRLSKNQREGQSPFALQSSPAACTAGAHEARAQWAKQREVSPMSKGTLQAARRSRVTIANCG